MYAFNVIISPLITAFVTFHKFGRFFFHFNLFISKYKKWDFYFGHVLFRSVLFNLQELREFSSYLFAMFFQYKSTMVESRHCMILLRCVLWLRMWSVLVNVPCTFEKNVYSDAVGWILYRCQLFSNDCFYWVLLHSYWFSA